MRGGLFAALLTGAAALAGVVPGGAAAQPVATYLGTFVWTGDTDGFGGLSAIEVTPDGMGFVVLSDRALITDGRFVREGGRINGAIVGIEAAAFRALTNGAGEPLKGPRADSEGLAVAPDGTRYISFEGPDPRVRTETGPEGVPAALPRNPDFAQYPGNSSLEALAIGPDGALYVIPERSGRFTRPFPVYRLRNGVWDVAFDIPRTEAFLVSGADIGPDGLLYVLERDFTGLGFRSRVRRFALDGSGGQTIFETGSLVHDNLEGISVWHDGTSIRLTMVSDDNFRFFQSTQIVEYRVDG